MVSDAHIFPQPTEDQLNEEAAYMLLLNPYWWSVVQGEMRHIAYPSRWLDYDAVESAIQQLFIPDELIDAEWVTSWDFRQINAGFSVVPGGGGQWVSGNGWQSTDLGSARQVHIEKTFAATNIIGFLLLYRLGTVATNTNQIEVKLLQNTEVSC